MAASLRSNPDGEDALSSQASQKTPKSYAHVVRDGVEVQGRACTPTRYISGRATTSRTASSSGQTLKKTRAASGRSPRDLSARQPWNSQGRRSVPALRKNGQLNESQSQRSFQQQVVTGHSESSSRRVVAGMTQSPRPTPVVKKMNSDTSSQKQPSNQSKNAEQSQSSIQAPPSSLNPGPVLAQNDDVTVAYKKKYKRLLEHEQEEHRRILAKSCDGEYTLEFCDEKLESSTSYPMYACICGLRDYQIAYVSQAAEVERKIGVHIYKKGYSRQYCRAHILQKNIDGTMKKLYIAFDERGNHFFQSYFQQDMRKETILRVDVVFQLKYSYFTSLHKSIDGLPSDVISRIQPSGHHNIMLSMNTSAEEEIKQCHTLDSEQQKALRAILCETHPASPPILITGPFGTGKTRIMAMAAHVLFQRSVTRILVCTQQRESADNFMSMYRDVVSSSGSDDQSVTNIILRHYGSQRHSLKTFYVTPENLLSCLKNSKTNLLNVTTCLTAQYLASTSIEFTHIFVDEGAQMREPEAIAALGMAKEHTKVVIAGDPQQVGPAMLVFGKKAREGGLDKSLLERLLLEYNKIHGSSPFSITLVTNYRCHDDIRKLSGDLFYPDTPLRLSHESNNQPRVFGLHGSKSALHFICSSVEDCVTGSNVNEKEAMAVVDTLEDINQQWPKHGLRGRYEPHQVCIMSKTRSQLQKIRECMSEKSREMKRRFRYVPTFSMQGNEYSVLVLSTSEPLQDDGSPAIDSSKSLCNPHVFNTAITRAESLVVAVGNPFLLLKTEKHVLEDPNYREKGKCWSNFLRHCIEHNTISFSNSSNVTEEEQKLNLERIKTLVQARLGKTVEYIPPDQRPHVKILEEEFKADCKLGDGGYGLVLKVKRLSDGRDLAIKLKVCMKEEMNTQKEAKKLAQLNHPNIVQYFDSGTARPPHWPEWKEWIENKSRFGQSSSSSSIQRSGYLQHPLCFYILTEWCEKGTLRDWLKSKAAKEHRDRATIGCFMKQILEALKYIHENNLVHRDLKPSNIFKSDETLKIGDFGFVKDIDEQCAMELSLSEDDQPLSRLYGTDHYRSPELRNRILRSKIDWQKVDIYASGVIFFELCWIFNSRERDKIMEHLLPVNETQKPQLPDRFKEQHCNEVPELVLSMTSFDLMQRPSAKEVLEGKLKSYIKKIKESTKKKQRKK